MSSRFYFEAKNKGWEMPSTFEEYAFYSYECKPLQTNYCSGKEVLEFRDNAWKKYACLNCDCAKKKALDLMRAEAFIHAISAGAYSGKSDEVQGMIDTITAICNPDDCNC